MKIRKVFISTLNKIPTNIKVNNGETIYYYFIYKGRGTLNKRINVTLKNPKSKFYLMGAVFLNNTSKLNLNINIDHKTGNNKAYVEIKTVLYGESVFNFEGLINISKKAHLVDSYLKQNNLVASVNSICNTSPQLKIGADNVKASHGATISGFNSEELFYLQSRGYNLDVAKNLLSESFLISVFGENANKVLTNLNINSISSI